MKEDVPSYLLMFIVNTCAQAASLDYGSRLENELDLLTLIGREINFLG
jgi:hypothetical protein